MAQRGVKVQLYSSKTSALEGSEWSAARPGRTLPPGKTRYPLYRRLGGICHMVLIRKESGGVGLKITYFEVLVGIRQVLNLTLLNNLGMRRMSSFV